MTRKKQDKETHDRLLGLLAAARDRQSETGPCPSPETLALFIDGRLTGTDRETVVRHLASCQSCYEVWLSVASDPERLAKPGTGEKSGKVSTGRKRVFGYLGTALAAAASVALYLNLQGVRQDGITTEQADTLMLQKTAPVDVESRALKTIVPAPTPAPLEPQVDKKESLSPQFAPPVRMLDEAAPVSEMSGAANMVKSKSMPAPQAQEGRTAAALPPEFTEAVRSACSAGTAGLEVWQRLYAEGTGYLQTESGGGSPEKLARVVRIIKTMIDSGDTKEGCRLLQGELAEEGESR